MALALGLKLLPDSSRNARYTLVMAEMILTNAVRTEVRNPDGTTRVEYVGGGFRPVPPTPKIPAIVRDPVTGIPRFDGVRSEDNRFRSS